MSPDLRELFDDAGRTPPTPVPWGADDVVHRGEAVRRRRRLVTVASTVGALAIVVAGVAALGPLAAHRGDPAVLGTSGPTPGTTTPAPSASTTPGPSTTPTPVATVAACRGSDVQLGVGDGGVAAGTSYLTVIASSSGRSCHLDGTPSVEALDSSGAPVAVAVTPSKDGGPAAGVVLVPTGHLSFVLAVANTSNYDRAACDPVAVPTLAVTLTAGTEPVHLALPTGVTTCRNDVSSFGLPLQVSGWRPANISLQPYGTGSASASG